MSGAEAQAVAKGLAAARPNRVRLVLALAWPTAIGYLLQNSYRINDQFWIQGLGPEAHTAAGAALFVGIMNFAIGFLPAGGALALASRAFGARDEVEFGSVARHALLAALIVGGALAVLGAPLSPWIVGLLGLEGRAAELAIEYLKALYLCSPALSLALIVEYLFLARGRTVVPMVLQSVAICLNWIWTPMLTYGPDAHAQLSAPGAAFAGDLARQLDLPALGMEGAAWATGLARLATGVAGLLILRFSSKVALVGAGTPRLKRLVEIARISVPVSLSIALYAGVYWAMLGLVLDRLPTAVTAGLGLGFQVFEGLAYPAFLGVGMACASLVGRHLGAKDHQAVFETIQSSRRVGRVLGIFAAVAFLLGGSLLGPLFTQDPAVLRELELYVTCLAFSQYWVAVETIHERVLLGAGHTRSIPWISGSVNTLRVPLAMGLALGLGWGGPGVWWAINATTWLKAYLFWREVRRGDWLR